MATTTHWDPNSAARVGIKFGLGQRRRVEGDLVGSGPQKAASVLRSSHATTNGEGDEDLVGRPGHHVDHGVAVREPRR